MCRDQTGRSKQENSNLIHHQLPHLLNMVVNEHLREILLGFRQNIQPEEWRSAGLHDVF